MKSNEKKVKDKINKFLPERLKNLEEKKKKKFYEIETYNFEGEFGENKSKTTYKVFKKYPFDVFYEIMKEINKEEIKRIEESLDERIDDNNYLYLRFNKRDWFLEDKLNLTEEGNCLHVKCHIQTYPAKKSKAKDKFKKLLDNLR